jgi:CubicO group peptidase (beta-lactamase class C family)
LSDGESTHGPQPRSTFSALAAWLSFTQLTFAQGITLDPAKKKRIDAVFAEYEQSKSPGCALGVMSDGELSYAWGYGLASLSPEAPIDATRLFDIASVSKQFTAASIVLLAQQGKLKLTDDVRKYIPELPGYGAPITINHLIWHTSGLRDYGVLLLLSSHDYPEVTTEAQALDIIARQQKLDFPTGTQYRYSNTGYFLLALIVKRVSGQDLNAFSRERIFNPLGMPNAVWRDRFDKPIANLARGHAPDGEGGFVEYMSNWEQIGDGALHLSIGEARKWDENFYHAQVGGPELIEEMLRRGKLNNGRQLIYARGLQVDSYRRLRRVRHGGDWVGYHSNLVRFPDQHTSVALMCNSEGIDQYELSTKVIDIVLEDVFTQPKPEDPPPTPSLPIERFVGQYYSSSHQQIFDIVVEDGVLLLKLHYIVLPLIAKGPTTFYLDDIPNSLVEFGVSGAAPAQSLTFIIDLDEPDLPPVRASRFAPVTAPVPSAFVGTYSSRELGVSWELAAVDGQLAVKDGPAFAALPLAGPLSPANQTDAYFGAAGLLRFTRDGEAQVNGFKLAFNGSIDFQFERQ